MRHGNSFREIDAAAKELGLPMGPFELLGFVGVKVAFHTAETLHEEALARKVPVSLATVYNTLHQFTEAGLLREVAVEGAKTYFDTNTSDHHHFFIEGENKVFDIAPGPVRVVNLPEPPDGMEIANVDIVVRLRPKRGA